MKKKRMALAEITRRPGRKKAHRRTLPPGMQQLCTHAGGRLWSANKKQKAGHDGCNTAGREEKDGAQIGGITNATKLAGGSNANDDDERRAPAADVVPLFERLRLAVAAHDHLVKVERH